jgi:glycosyltransferase involved in cell wall biosynthesis
MTIRTVEECDRGAPEVSVVMPCLNEAKTLATCIHQIQTTFREHNISGEIIVADNGSDDGSSAIAERLGARIVPVSRRGYGSALMGGVDSARGKFVIIGDADCSYDFGHIPRLLEKLRGGNDLVIGNRFRGGIGPGAMPALHKHFGTPLLSGIGRLFFKAPCGDFNCGLRGFSKAAYNRMDLRATGMEFASEMIVKASLLNMRIAEVPTTLSPDGRDRPPHLRSWRDGWRHLRFMLLYSPRWLFLYPGLMLMVVGVVTGLLLLPKPRTVGNIRFDVHTLLYAAMAVLVGFQAVAFATFTKVFGVSEGLLPEDPLLNRLFRYITLETGLAVGFVLIFIGLVASFLVVGSWDARHFGALDPEQTLRLAIPGGVSLTLGFEVVLSSFFLSVLEMKRVSAVPCRADLEAHFAKQAEKAGEYDLSRTESRPAVRL